MISIIIKNNKEVDLTTTNGLEETEIAAEAVRMMLLKMHNDKDCHTEEFCLALTSFDITRKLWAVKEVKENLGIGLKEAKNFVDECQGGHCVVLARGTESEIKELAKKFDQNGSSRVEVF